MSSDRKISVNWKIFSRWTRMGGGRAHVRSKRARGTEGSGPRRRPREGGYARGEETRERIIQAAFEVFSEEGYLGASTRLIAARAGVNPPALQYYFDSKEGLHEACGQWVIDRMMGGFAPVLEAARAARASGRREAMLEALQDLVERIADLTMPRTDEEGWRRFLGRCQTRSSGYPAFALIEREFTAPIQSMVISLVTQVLGLEEGDERARIRALLILGQLWVLNDGADSTLEALGWTDFAGDRAARVKEILRDHVARLLTSPLPGTSTSPSHSRR